jgi:enoyl-CoA hydratase/carnithine racemase
MQIASELAMTCRRLSAQEALSFGLANKISQTPASVVDESLIIAAQIASLPADAVMMTRQGLREAWEIASVQHSTSRVSELFSNQVAVGRNSKIGLDAFFRKVKPEWGPS